MYIPFDELRSIHQKVVVDNDNFQPLSKIMYSRTAYSLTPKAHEDFPDAKKNFSAGNQYQMSSNVFDLMPEIFFDEKPADDYEYIQLYGRKNNERVFKWVRRDYVTYHESLEKFKVFVPDSNGSGAYIKSRFCRAMLGILKVTQHNPPQTWAKVPLQNFNPATSDIDWRGDVDRQLYDKYGLSKSEREFIEPLANEMLFATMVAKNLTT